MDSSVFDEGQNLVSARVPSRFKSSLYVSTLLWFNFTTTNTPKIPTEFKETTKEMDMTMATILHVSLQQQHTPR
jgi:hypothetical protein